MAKVDMKDIKLDLDALIVELVFGHGFLHYGYWPDGLPCDASALDIGIAQRRWFDVLAQQIPTGTQSILDVGSGTGANTAALHALGYDLTCVCPSEQLNALARRKLPLDVLIHSSTFEEFSSGRTFDTCIFAESLHYIDTVRAFEQIDKYVRKSVVIFDYFRRASDGTGARTTHDHFLRSLASFPHWEIVIDQDVTPQIVPTFKVLEDIKASYLAPFLDRSLAAIRQGNPVLAFFVRMFLRKKLYRFVRPTRRAEAFSESFEYRLISLRRRGGR